MAKKQTRQAKTSPDLQERLRLWLKTSVWVYPAVLLLGLAFFTALKISGTSAGMYHQLLYGINSSDPNLIYGSPKAVRADEWQGATPLTVGQAANDYPKVNAQLGSGRDLGLVVETPYRHWSTVFKPQNWPFFVMGFEHAFAMKWWLPLFLLLVSSYFFVLKLFPGRRWLAVFFSLSVGLSPFLLWWYQTSAVAGMAYGFMLLILIRRILENEPIARIRNTKAATALTVGALAFILTCFALLLYPPFQISIAVVVLFYGLGYVAGKLVREPKNRTALLKRLALLAVGAAVAGIISFVFINGNKAPIDAISGSLYPGKRVTRSGDLQPLRLVHGYLMPLQQDGVVLFRNLSESSTFITLLPFLLLPGYLLLAYEYRKTKKLDWLFLAIQLICTLLLFRASVSFGDSLYKPLLINRVPGARLLIGIGFAGFLQLLFFMKKYQELKLAPLFTKYLPLVLGGLTLAVLIAASLFVDRHYDTRGHGYAEMSLLGLGFAAIVAAAVAKRPTLALGLLLLFSAASSFRIMPLYRGLGNLTDNDLTRTIQKVSKPGDSWVILDNLEFENLAFAAGRQNLSGSQVYPDNKFWEALGGTKFEPVYNREGHATFTTKPIADDMVLIKPNLYEIKFQCSNFITQNVDYVIALKEIGYPCLRPVTEIDYPRVDFYIYKMNR